MYSDFLGHSCLGIIGRFYVPFPRGSPPPDKTGKAPTQYWPTSSGLDQSPYQWYKLVDGRFIKFVPANIAELLTPGGLVHWLMLRVQIRVLGMKFPDYSCVASMTN